MKCETEFLEIPLESLVEAKWNYKKEGDRERIDKLKNSIEFDKSIGVPAVREIGNGLYEVIDGNHRLVAIRELQWKSIQCENFGNISKAKAITIARRRNSKWFDDDILKLGQLYNEDVLKEYSSEFLESIGPDTKDDIFNFSNLGSANWTDVETDFSSDRDSKNITLTFKVPETVNELWEEWKKINKASNPNLTEVELFEYAIAEALNGRDKND